MGLAEVERAEGDDLAPVLCDPDHDHMLRVEGYAVVPVLDLTEVAELRATYRAEVPEAQGPGGMRFDYMQEDRESMRRVTAVVEPIWERHLPQVFTDHRVVFTTFVHKHPGTESGMFLHDDRTFVDEDLHRAHTMWVALVDTSAELRNGALQVVPRSHRIMPAASGSSTPDWIRPYETALRRHLVTVTVPAGHALVYDSKTLHCSPPNETDEVREAIAVAVAPRGAQLIHVVADGRRRLVYEVDPGFFIDVHPHSIEADGMPEGYRLLREYDEPLEHTTPEQIGAALGVDAATVARDPEPEPHPDPDPDPGLEPDAFDLPSTEACDRHPSGSAARRAVRRLRTAARRASGRA